MVSIFVLGLEAAFFAVSVIGSAVAIYELRGARAALSDELLKKVITWIMYSSFLLAILSGIVAVNFLSSFSPDLFLPISETTYVTALFVLIWLAIICNIAIAMKIKDIGKAFGFKETNHKELFFMKYFEKRKNP
ncbi:MAG: hypothetical protein AABX01_06190 [Candidatus Micrarchaeota archaeon]